MNKHFNLKVAPEESKISLGFDDIGFQGDYKNKNSYTTIGEDFIINTVSEDDYIDNDNFMPIVDVNILLTDERKFYNNYKTVFNDLTDYSDNNINIEKAKYLGIYELLEIGLTDNTYEYLNVEKYLYAEYKIFRSDDKKVIKVIFYVE